MTWLVQPRLVNPPFSDPGLLVDFRFGRRAILFDLGDLGGLSPREALRVTDILVSHRHMDHFAGFDALLRLRLHRPGALRIIGPPGMTAGVEAKLRAYAWNLLGPGSADFAILAADHDGARLGPWTAFRAQDAFGPSAAPQDPPAEGLCISEDEFRVETRALDHGIPSLAFAVQERLRVNVRPEALRRLGLSPGPWLNAAKSAVRRGLPEDAALETPDGPRPLAELREAIFQTGPGQRVAYATDLAFTEGNRRKVLDLARDPDHLFLEAVFLHDDAAEAEARRHLTARQAGDLAREARARRLTVFHHSPRYLDRPDALRAEAEAAFRA